MKELVFFPDESPATLQLEGQSVFTFVFGSEWARCLLLLTFLMPTVATQAETMPANDALIEWHCETNSFQIMERPIVDSMLARLESFQKLEAGWGAKDSMPINSGVLQLVCKALGEMSDSEIEGWTVNPDERGFLGLHYKKNGNRAGIVVTPGIMAYYIWKQGEKRIKGTEALSSLGLRRLMSMA